MRTDNYNVTSEDDAVAFDELKTIIGPDLTTLIAEEAALNEIIQRNNCLLANPRNTTIY